MTLRVMVSRHSAFYSPLILTLSAGFLEQEGLSATYSVLGPGQRSHVLIRDGVVDIMQSAVSSNWKPMERGETPLPVHIALINRRDGFFLASRGATESFVWTALEGRTLLADHALQPFAMLRYALHRNGVDWSRIRVVDAGTPEEMEAAFRSGAGDYVHLQGPAAHQLANDGVAAALLPVGAAVPPVAFSTLCCSREYAATDACAGFLRAYERARQWARTADATEAAGREAAYFPRTAPAALAAAVRDYQNLSCWEGSIRITPDLYSQALEVFSWSGDIATRPAFESVCTMPTTP
jgi:NitT/TauT family transport system substrate-binding protein